MSGYAIDPMQPLPKRWRDKGGPLRLMCEPHDGYVMMRRPGAMPFVESVRGLLSGKYEPVLPPPRINVRERVKAIRAEQETAFEGLR